MEDELFYEEESYFNEIYIPFRYEISFKDEILLDIFFKIKPTEKLEGFRRSLKICYIDDYLEYEDLFLGYEANMKLELLILNGIKYIILHHDVDCEFMIPPNSLRLKISNDYNINKCFSFKETHIEDKYIYDFTFDMLFEKSEKLCKNCLKPFQILDDFNKACICPKCIQEGDID